MRQIVLDTETTGLDPLDGHRIIEIGAVELIDRRITGRHYHQYLWPERDIDAAALEVHGLSLEFLRNSPRFGDIAEEFLDFVRDAELIIHNAPFDIGFLNHEFERLGSSRKVTDCCNVIDTLVMARERHPGQKNSLDALCRRYEVDNSERSLHGALLDSEILADVYLRMTGGQAVLLLEPSLDESKGPRRRHHLLPGNVRNLVRVSASMDELAAHARRLDTIHRESGGRCVWLLLEGAQSPDTVPSD